MDNVAFFGHGVECWVIKIMFYIINQIFNQKKKKNSIANLVLICLLIPSYFVAKFTFHIFFKYLCLPDLFKWCLPFT